MQSSTSPSASSLNKEKTSLSNCNQALRHLKHFAICIYINFKLQSSTSPSASSLNKEKTSLQTPIKMSKLLKTKLLLIKVSGQNKCNLIYTFHNHIISDGECLNDFNPIIIIIKGFVKYDVVITFT